MKIVLAVMYVLFLVNQNVHCGEDEKLLQLSKTWADRLGADLWMFGMSVTRKDAFFERYNKSASISLKDGDALTLDIETRIRQMMEQKVLAVQRIMDAASNLAASSKDDPDPDFSYYSAKELINNLTNPPEPNATQAPRAEEYKQTAKLLDPLAIDDELPAGDDTYLDDEALPEETVKVVSDGEAESVQASQQEGHNPPPVDKRYLNLTENPNFFNIPVNMEHSAVHVPSNVYNKSKDVIQGIIWSDKLDSIFVENYRADPTLSWQYFGSGTGFMRQFPAMIWHQEPVDVFDCRTRAWYIEAASSPKDVVVLVDRSGSMTGMQQEIAKHVVNNILDTLGNNDYVNIFLFSNVTDPLVPCFNDTLVQANLANVRELKEGMEEYKTENIANFSDALTVAFKLLENYRIGSRNKSGAGCNQAIMLVTDGVQYNYKELFEAYNWRDWPYKPVRVFTYLIGREVSDVREVKWMACANQGYYVHLSTFAEVREQVLHYIPVMARPMVLWANPPQPTWSPVYADVTDPKLTNWLWTQRQRRDQRERFLSHRKHPHRHTSDSDKKWVHQQKKPQDHYGDLQSYTLMTSVSMPVYDRRQNATRVANLLGVAGTDVPITYIQQLMTPHLIGVNGYAYIITNNGYALIHPDLRPVFQGILKPAYNRVDLVEVELPDDDLDPRDFNRTLLEMRREVVFQRNDKKTLDMKYHLDDMKRIMRGRRHFHYRGIEGTPFTLVVALPDKYGNVKVQHALNEDIYLQISKKNIDITKYFIGNKWKIHPDWRYCKDMSGVVKYNSSEEELLEFLKKTLRERIQWSHKYTPCDRDLVTALVYEAKCTDFFNQNITTLEEKKGEKFIKSLGFTIAFIATHSGLTRWQDFPQNIQPDEEGVHKPHFSEVHNRAIDEVWYRRAVEQYFVEEDSFVYAVPIDVGKEKNTVVTASHAVFYRKAPVAVVGHQFYHENLLRFFYNITGDRCSSSSNVSCYILDNNAYVVLSSVDEEETGRWLGDVDYGLLRLLVDDTETPVFRRVQMYDYQAVCFPVKEEKSRASFLFSPVKHLSALLHSTLTTLLYLLSLVSADPDSTSEYSTIVSNQPPTKQNEKEFDKSVLINKTKPTPCDETRWLYELVPYKGGAAPYNKAMRKDKPWLVQRVQYSNLVLMLVDDIHKPVKHLSALLHSTLTTLLYLLSLVSADPDSTSEYSTIVSNQPPTKQNEKEFDKSVLINKTKPTPCDETRWLYELVPYKGGAAPYNKAMRRDKPWLVQRVQYSNLVLMLVDDIHKPVKHLSALLHSTLTTLLYLLSLVSADPDSTSEYSTIVSNQPPTKQNEKEFDKSVLINKTKPTPCDETRWLYELVPYKGGAAPYNKAMRKDKPWLVQRVQYSNLVLMLVKKGLKFEEEYFMETPTPTEIDYNMTLACRIREDDLPRRRYAKCVNKHINESLIELCGRSSYLYLPTKYFLFVVSILPALLLRIE